MKINKAAVSAIAFGNIVEWYDFSLYGIFASIISQKFFPATDPSAAKLLVYSVFAIGFICRPLGAILFGHFGDRFGRIRTLRASIMMLGLPTLLMALIPDYAMIGVLSSILFILLRVVQGICLGGEFAGTMIYLAEMAPPKHRALLTSCSGTGANAGILLASVVAMLCHLWFSPAALSAYGWRLAFVVGGLISVVIWIARLGLSESTVFTTLKKQQRVVSVPFLTVWREAKLPMLRTICLTAVGAALYYIGFIYLSNFLIKTRAIQPAETIHIQTAVILLMLVTVPLAAISCDRIGRKASLAIVAIATASLAIPGFYGFIHGQPAVILLMVLVLSWISSLEQGSSTIAVVENFPAHLRYTGIALSYNIGVALFGGCAPLLVAWLVHYTGQAIAPAYYLIATAAITGIAAIFFMQETKDKPLLD